MLNENVPVLKDLVLALSTFTEQTTGSPYTLFLKRANMDLIYI